LPEFLLLTERVSRHLRTSASASIALAKQRERRFVGPGLSFVRSSRRPGGLRLRRLKHP
jgi:hypothetical protein